MVHVTPGIRWAMGIWCVVAVLALGASIALGAGPLSTVALLVLFVAPLGVLTSLVQFRVAARTAGQVLHDDDRDRGARS
jgi:hypothetical protein